MCCQKLFQTLSHCQIINTDLCRLNFTWADSLVWGLPTYVLLQLEIGIIRKIAEIKLFSRQKEYPLQNIEPKALFFVCYLSYDSQIYIKEVAYNVTIRKNIQILTSFTDQFLVN